MNTRNNTLISIAGVGLVLLMLVGLTWINYRYSVQNPGGSDFLPTWVGTRMFLMEGVSPYADVVTQEIQQRFYGRPARPGEDQILFPYPFYSIFIFSPFALIGDYNTARAVWMTVLEVAIILIVLASLSLNNWKPSLLALGGLLIFGALWYYSIRPLINGNTSILVSLIVVAALLAIRAEIDGLAGFLLALSTIKPQMVVLFILFILIWAVSQRRWILVWGFLGSLGLMTAVTMLFIPNWIWQNLVQMIAYSKYTLPTIPRGIFKVWVPGVGNQLGWGLTIMLISGLILEWRYAWGKEFRWFLWTACLTLAATPIIGLPAATENYLILFPGVVMIFNAWDERWHCVGRGLIGLSYILLFFGVWWLFLATLERGNQPMQNPIMFFPLPIFLLVDLYWVRWWVLRPERPLLDQWRNTRRQMEG